MVRDGNRLCAPTLAAIATIFQPLVKHPWSTYLYEHETQPDAHLLASNPSAHSEPLPAILDVHGQITCEVIHLHISTNSSQEFFLMMSNF